ncbi:hypothetical protein S7335_327 [Synechococcus sp. PCC 7335]|nr:hypothetical protein S7335_327 [Synechococcus sp. PCC 7335]
MTSREAQETYLKNQQNVIQRIKKDVDGTTVDLTRGYTSWERDGKWHINWALGEGDVYHVTSEDYNPKKHYFFTWRAGVIEDAVAPKDMKGRKGTSNKFSALPSAVQSFIRNNISELVGR